MPELPEVETVCRGLSPVIAGKVLARVIQRRPDLRIPFPTDFVERLQGRRVASVSRRAKYIMVHLDSGDTLVIHLGMSGRINIASKGHYDPATGYGAHDHVAFYTDDGAQVLYHDPRRFGLMTIVGPDEMASHRLFRDIGPEPLGNGFNEETLVAALKGRKSPIKAALLDQTVVAGLGNIYVCEALYRAGVSPCRMAHMVTGGQADKLVGVIRDVLREAIASGGSTLRDYAQVDGELGYFQHRFTVYGREGEPCQTAGCTSKILRLVQSNRSTFYCPVCQK